MRTYSALNLQEVIDALRAIPGDPLVRGMSGSVHSHSAYYSRAAVTPVTYTVRASVLADDLQAKVGTLMSSYGYGSELVDGTLPLHIADYGEDGPVVAGFEPVDNETGVYEPVCIARY